MLLAEDGLIIVVSFIFILKKGEQRHPKEAEETSTTPKEGGRWVVFLGLLVVDVILFSTGGFFS